MSNPIVDSYEGGLCPDCSELIPQDVEEGEECANCGHVFYSEERDLIMSSFVRSYD
jgi:hypothetical protein